jgi:hypothetical protein
MSRRRHTARRLSAAGFTAAGLVLGYFLLFRAGGAAPGSASAAPAAKADVPAKPVVISLPPAPKPKAPDPAPLIPPDLDPAPPPKQEPPKPAQEPAYKTLLDSGRPHEARRAMAELFASTDSDALRADLAEKCIAVNRKLLIATSDPRDIDFVTIAHGENPTAVARRVRSLHGEPGLLFLLNGMRPGTVIRAGAKLRVTRGTWSLFVDKSLFRLWVLYEGAPFKEYPVCIGAEDKTPAAKWSVDLKNPKPTWTAPPEWIEKENLRNPIPYGHPKNPLGEYWIGLEAPGFMGFGIHGTNQPDTIGQKASNGCIRLLNADVVELAGCVWKGMPVVSVE